MKLELTFTERFYLISMMPAKDNFANLVIRKDIKDRIQLTQDEQVKNKFTVNGDSTSWLDNGEKITVEISNPEKAYLKAIFTKLNQTNELVEHLINIYESII